MDMRGGIECGIGICDDVFGHVGAVLDTGGDGDESGLIWIVWLLMVIVWAARDSGGVTLVCCLWARGGLPWLLGTKGGVVELGLGKIFLVFLA